MAAAAPNKCTITYVHLNQLGRSELRALKSAVQKHCIRASDGEGVRVQFVDAVLDEPDTGNHLFLALKSPRPVRKKQQLCGFAIASQDERDVTLEVLCSADRQGKPLANAVRDWAIGLDQDVIHTEALAQIEGFYKRLGFQRVRNDPEATPPGEEKVYMVNVLPTNKAERWVRMFGPADGGGAGGAAAVPVPVAAVPVPAAAVPVPAAAADVTAAVDPDPVAAFATALDWPIAVGPGYTVYRHAQGHEVIEFEDSDNSASE